MDQKDTIIVTAIQLINENNGDLSKVTARKIAERAGVGLGLINYHFGSKDNLVTECVQKIISEQIHLFVPKNISYSDNPYEEDKQRLAYWAKQVFEFLYANRSISTISILGDMKNNLADSNSVHTQMGFERAIQSNIDEDKKKLMLFTLTSTMQGAFLQDKVVSDRLGFDLTKKEQREKYIDSLIEILFGGIVSHE